MHKHTQITCIQLPWIQKKRWSVWFGGNSQILNLSQIHELGVRLACHGIETQTQSQAYEMRNNNNSNSVNLNAQASLTMLTQTQTQTESQRPKPYFHGTNNNNNMIEHPQQQQQQYVPSNSQKIPINMNYMTPDGTVFQRNTNVMQPQYQHKVLFSFFSFFLLWFLVFCCVFVL